MQGQPLLDEWKFPERLLLKLLSQGMPHVLQSLALRFFCSAFTSIVLEVETIFSPSTGAFG